jgi:UDPglucose 6-dehydrogenase
MKLCFIGTGYVGLVSGAMFASMGHVVNCIDSDKHKISLLQSGKLPIYEPDLHDYVQRAVNDGLLKFGSEYSPQSYDAIFIAVGTPSLDSGAVDLRYVEDALEEAAKIYSSKTLIVIKSTIPPGTCSKLQKKLQSAGYTHEIASNPEFLREGSAVYDFLNPDRIVIGTSSTHAEEVLRNIYRPLKNQNIVSTDPATSELIKYASNAFLATKVAFINEMANLCDKVGANIGTLSIGLGSDRRIGKEFLKAGPGFGGSCFPKDIMGLSHIAKEYGQPCHVIDAVIFSNQARRQYMSDKIERVLGDLNGKTICVLGITFKAGTDDVRSSPAVDITQTLIERGASIKVYDPEGMKNAKVLLTEAEFCSSPYGAANKADAVVLLTEWQEFMELDFDRIGNSMNQKLVFDFRNILSQDKIVGAGFNYFSV